MDGTDFTGIYRNIAMTVLSGEDDNPGVVYDILYNGVNESYEVDNLVEDYKYSCVFVYDIW